MKRKSTTIGIFAIAGIVLTIVYQFIFADHRARLKVDTYKYAGLPIRFTKFQAVSASSRMLIYDGTLEFEVEQVNKARRSILAMVTDLGGYVSSDSEYEKDGPHITQIVRIPTESVNDFIQKISGLSSNITAKRIEATDVTEEFIDAGSTLSTKKKLEARYLDIIQRANNVEDLLKVEAQLGVVRGRIDSIERRIKRLSNRIALGTLTLDYYEKSAPPSSIFAESIATSFNAGWAGLILCVTMLAAIWPLLIIASAVLIYFRFKRTIPSIKA